MAMGRLERPKGFDLLIQAFAQIAVRHQNWNLVILGEGSERAELQQMIESLGLSDRIALKGFVENPGASLARADLFVLSSRWEGLSMAVMEALAIGLPVISFDCPSGPAEMIDHGRNGLLVEPENVGLLAKAMDRLIDDKSLRKSLAQQASKSVRKKFGVDHIVDQWEHLLTDILNGKGSEAL
jgi:glycosyltransferase involved in cell wall biosynthesis